jgi:hypothetical protein
MLSLLVTLALADDEVPVPLEELPPKVRSAVEARFPGATLVEAEREGKLYDVVVRTAEGELWEAEVKPSGKIVEVEREDDDDDEDDEDDEDD